MKIKRNTRAVYVIENLEVGRVKIGVSNNPKHRVKALMLQSGCKLALRYYSAQIEYSEKIESNLHAMFIEKRYVGEWFNIGVKEAINAVKRLVKNRHDCNIIRKYEGGISISEIARENKISRNAIVNYLLSKGYRPKDRKNKVYKKAKYIPCEPLEIKPKIEMTKLEKMVYENNKKIAELRKGK